jgi:hypothetical protein
MDPQRDRFWGDDEKADSTSELEVDELEAYEDDETLGDARAGDGNVNN